MSRRANFAVFDDYVPMGSSPVYTSAAMNQALAVYDQMAIQAVIDNVTRTGGTAGFELNIQTSGDGRNWANLNPTGTPEVSIDGTTPGLFTTKTNIATGSFPGSVSQGALLSYVRFAIQFSENTTAAHVKVYVTQRDQAHQR